jgi:hypothetical protein
MDFSTGAFFVPHPSKEDPIAAKVFGPDPSGSFPSMSAFGPSPERLEYGVVYLLEGLLTDHVAVIVRPSPYDGIEFFYQLSG